MRIELGRIRNVTHRQHLQLDLSLATCRIDGEEDGPSDGTANQADVAEDFEIAQKEEAVEGSIVENKRIGVFEERLDPVEESGG
jgi:hypothetical protein